MVEIFDCTMRDGANVPGLGFPADMTKMMLRGLIDNGITVIEYGGAHGINSYKPGEVGCTDEEYFEIARPYYDKAEIGTFMGAKRYTPELVKKAADGGMKFVRVGANAGTGLEVSIPAIHAVKNNGMKCRYSLMKAYVSTPEELAEEAKGLQDEGVDLITIMDSAGCMLPGQVTAYVDALKSKLTIPVGFHCHNNLCMSAANALAAYKAGADSLDSGLLGMARSAGNMATEVSVALLQQQGEAQYVNFFGLLEFLDKELIPAMKQFNYHVAVKPLDLVLGVAGCHSSFVKTFRKVAQEMDVNLYKLIIEVSKKDRRSPTEDLMRTVAASLKA